MTQKKTPPSFVEGWERIPGASNYEISAQGQARNMQTKKLIASAPDADGCVMIYGDEKKLEKFNLKEIAAKLFPEKTIEMDEIITLEKEKIVIPENLIIAEESKSEIKPIKKSPKMPSKKPTPKKATVKASAPKKGQSPNKPAKVAETKPQAHAKAKLGKVSIEEKQKTLAANKKQPTEKKLSISFQINLMHHQGKSGEEITKTLGISNKKYLDNRWLYENRGYKEKIVKYLAAKK